MNSTFRERLAAPGEGAVYPCRDLAQIAVRTCNDLVEALQQYAEDIPQLPLA